MPAQRYRRRYQDARPTRVHPRGILGADHQRRPSTWRTTRAQPASASCRPRPGAQVKREWRSESIGWFDADDQLVGAGLVLYRQLPKIKKYLAYLPEGPVDRLARRRPRRPGSRRWPTTRSAPARSAYASGPPVVVRRWRADTIKAAIADERVTRLSEAMPDHVDHQASPAPEPAARARLAPAGRGGGLRRRSAPVRLPAADRRPDRGAAAGRDEPALAAQHQEGGQGSACVVTQGTPMILQQFHPLYVETAERDDFTPRPLSYFQHDVRRHCWPRTRTGSGCTWPTTKATWSRRRPGSGSASTPGTPTAPARRPSGTYAGRTRSSGG